MESLSSRRPASKQTADGAEIANREGCTVLRTDDTVVTGVHRIGHMGLNARQLLYIGMAGK